MVMDLNLHVQQVSAGVITLDLQAQITAIMGVMPNNGKVHMMSSTSRDGLLHKQVHTPKHVNTALE